MKQLSRDAFAQYHPLVNLLWFVFALCFAVLLKHPAYLAVSLLGACGYAFTLGVKKALAAWTVYAPVIVFTALLNPLFSHEGATIIGYLPGGNPLTKEAVFYGVASGVSLATSLMLFLRLASVLTSDKLTALLCKGFPALSMLFSMILGFVPRFLKRAKDISYARRAMLGAQVQTDRRGKLKEAGKTVSAMATWCLEGTASTADNMKCRGYGLPGRTSFNLYRFELRDAAMLGAIVTLAGVVLICYFLGYIRFDYYPVLSSSNTGVLAGCAFAAHVLLCAMPCFINVWEVIRWRCILSKI